MSRGQVSCYQSDTSQKQGEAQQRPPVLTEQAHQRKTRKTHNFTLHLFPSVPLEWSQMKGRYCSGSSTRLKISSWHEFKNSVWNVNALENSSFPAGVLPHKTRKPLKSLGRLLGRTTSTSANLIASATGPTLGTGNLKAPLVSFEWLFLCSLNSISLIFRLWFCWYNGMAVRDRASVLLGFLAIRLWFDGGFGNLEGC